MFKFKNIRPKNIAKSVNITRHNVFQESWESREECIQRVINEKKIKPEELNKTVFITIINDYE